MFAVRRARARARVGSRRPLRRAREQDDAARRVRGARGRRPRLDADASGSRGSGDGFEPARAPVRARWPTSSLTRRSAPEFRKVRARFCSIRAARAGRAPREATDSSAFARAAFEAAGTRDAPKSLKATHSLKTKTRRSPGRAPRGVPTQGAPRSLVGPRGARGDSTCSVHAEENERGLRGGHARGQGAGVRARRGDSELAEARVGRARGWSGRTRPRWCARTPQRTTARGFFVALFSRPTRVGAGASRGGGEEEARRKGGLSPRVARGNARGRKGKASPGVDAVLRGEVRRQEETGKRPGGPLFR